MLFTPADDWQAADGLWPMLPGRNPFHPAHREEGQELLPTQDWKESRGMDPTKSATAANQGLVSPVFYH